MAEMGVEYIPADAPNDKVRVPASIWSDAPGGGKFVVPLDSGPRRFIRVKRSRGVWREIG